MLVEFNRRLKGNKALDPAASRVRRVAALDGTEFLSSQSRCGEFCLHAGSSAGRAGPTGRVYTVLPSNGGLPAHQ